MYSDGTLGNSFQFVSVLWWHGIFEQEQLGIAQNHRQRIIDLGSALEFGRIFQQQTTPFRALLNWLILGEES